MDRGVRQIEAIEILASHAGNAAFAAAQVAISAIESVTGAELAIRARAFFDSLIENDDAQRAFSRAAGRGAGEKVGARFFSRLVSLLIQRQREFEIAIVRIQNRARRG